MKTLKEYGQLDEIVRQEVNTKTITRVVGETEKGLLELVWDGNKYMFTLAGEDVTTDKLLEEVAIPLLNNHYQYE